MADIQSRRTSCKSPFKQLEILPAQWQHILALINIIINIQESFPTNSSIQNINTSN